MINQAMSGSSEISTSTIQVEVHIPSEAAGVRPRQSKGQQCPFYIYPCMMSWPEWNMIYVRSAAHDVAHCSLQTRSTRLTTAIAHTYSSTIGSHSGLLLLQLGLLFNSAGTRKLWASLSDPWLVQSWMQEFSQTVIVFDIRFLSSYLAPLFS